MTETAMGAPSTLAIEPGPAAAPFGGRTMSAEMSLRYGRIFDATVRAEYERALDLVKSRLGPISAGHQRLPLAADWREAEAIKTRLTGGVCLRAPVQGACPYANICEHCPSFRIDADSLPVVAAQRRDAAALAADAEARGWDSEVARHRRLTRRARHRGRGAMTAGDPPGRVETALAHLVAADRPITFRAVAEEDGVARATLYRNPSDPGQRARRPDWSDGGRRQRLGHGLLVRSRVHWRQPDHRRRRSPARSPT